jgi:hypothetical protein
MLEHLPASHHKDMERFGEHNQVEKDSPLWRADWGLKQWVPYLLGNND